jgi:hypothetical protein
MSADQKAELDTAFDTAVQQTIESTADGKIVVSHTQDVSAILEANKRQREEASPLGMGRFKQSKSGMNFTHAARVPLTVAMEIKTKYGLDMLGYSTPEQMQRIYRIIQTEYPYCMTVPGNVFGRG